MRPRSLLFFAAAVLLTGGLGYWLSDATLKPGPSPKSKSSSPAVLYSGPVATANIRALSVQAGTSPIGDEGNSKELLLRFNRSQSLRAFIFDAIKHPEWGGLQFAESILIHCRRYPLDAVAPATATTEQSVAFSALVTRCDMAKEENTQLSNMLSGDRLNELLTKIRSLAFAYPKGDVAPDTLAALLKSSDPDRNLMAALHTPGLDRSAKAAAITRVLATENPFLVFFALDREESTSNSPTELRVYFDNKWYAFQDNVNAVYLAYDLATCQMGLECGANSFKALSLCASRGFCGDSVANAIRNGLADSTHFQSETIEKLAREMTAAIQHGNAHAFMPPETSGKP